MLTRRKTISSVALALTLTMLMTVSASAQQAALGGSAYFRDANAASDKLVIDFTGAMELPHGSRYEAWLVDGDGGEDDTWVSAGTLGRGPYLRGEYVSPDGTDLLARYTTFLITTEALDDDDPAPSGNVSYGAKTRGPVLSGITSLLAPAAAVRDQAVAVLADARAASSADDLDARKTRAQNVIDALDGVVAQAQAASSQANDLVLSGATAGLDPVDETANDIIEAANCVVRLAGATKAAAMRVVDAPSSDIALKVETQNLMLDADRLYNGTSRDGGALGGVCLGGGALAIYEKTQDLGAFRPGVGAPPATGDALVSTVALAALLAGLAFALGGGTLILRSRRPTAAVA